EQMESLEKTAACERFLQELRFTQFRVKFHGDLVRIEVTPKEIQQFFESSTIKAIVQKFKEIGFSYVSLDLEGYRNGSMNEALGNQFPKGKES
ncbi:MAG: TIGR00268 family protein, partial [Candidatus Binatia bacterium]